MLTGVPLISRLKESQATGSYEGTNRRMTMATLPSPVWDAGQRGADDETRSGDLRRDADHLRRALHRSQGERISVEAERDSLLAALQHMSAPVIPIADGVVVMPLLGDAYAQRAQAQSLLMRQTTAQANTIDSTFMKFAFDAEELAELAAELYAHAATLAQPTLWNAHSAMFRSTENQFVNGPDDLLSAFVPNWVQVDEALLDELNVLAHLGPALKVKFARDAHSVATYIFGKQCRFMMMYPNRDPRPDHPGGLLADEFPPDFGLVGDPVFWTIADEHVNPERIARWTAAYSDNAGTGLMISAIAPIYVGEESAPRTMIGIDVGLAQVEAVVDAAARGVRRAAVLVDHRGHLVVATEQAYAMLGLPRAADTERGADMNLDLMQASKLPAEAVAAMRRGESSVEQIRVGGDEFLLACAPVPSVGWSLAVITAVASMHTSNGSTFVAELLAGIDRHHARVAVLDATGVVSIDHATIQRIVEAVHTAKLLGTKVLLAGITPPVAQMIVELNIDLSHLQTFPDLRSALDEAEAIVGKRRTPTGAAFW